jgi:hypothetical protein
LNTPLMKFDGKEKIRKERTSKWKIEMQWKMKSCFLYFQCGWRWNRNLLEVGTLLACSSLTLWDH